MDPGPLFSRSVLSSAEFDADLLGRLMERSVSMKEALESGEVFARNGGKLLTLFFEPSTRTRLSFESAAHSLGLGVMSVANAARDSSAAKKESLADAARIMSAYADVIVVRHPTRGAVAEFAAAAHVPVINAGDGDGEHPTQTLVDLFTIHERLGRFDLHVAVCGDLRYGRTVHSLVPALLNLGATIYTVSPPDLELRKRFLERLRGDQRDRVHRARSVGDVLPDVDVLYMTRVQRERLSDDIDYDDVASSVTLEARQLAAARRDMVIMHPLPRVDELHASVDADPRAAYFQQAANGVPVRMALLAEILGT